MSIKQYRNYITNITNLQQLLHKYNNNPFLLPNGERGYCYCATPTEHLKTFAFFWKDTG